MVITSKCCNTVPTTFFLRGRYIPLAWIKTIAWFFSHTEPTWQPASVLKMGEQKKYVDYYDGKVSSVLPEARQTRAHLPAQKQTINVARAWNKAFVMLMSPKKQGATHPILKGRTKLWLELEPCERTVRHCSIFHLVSWLEGAQERTEKSGKGIEKNRTG